ncbi:MAG: helix-turn-helix domain-containing protein [Clostridia bacterium]|nr:helix-turn-helix domain-containing protein [Clostridia bacterium]
MNVLQDLRKKRKITQQQLADYLGVPRTTLAHYESGRNEMGYDLLCRTADYFEVSVDALLGREGKGDLFDDARTRRPEIIEIYDQLSDAEQRNLLNYARGMIAMKK